jgi:hypothetical protein
MSKEKKLLKDSLWHFFKSEHNLILLDSEVFDIINLIENKRFNILKTISDCREKVDAEVPFGKEDAYDAIINEVDKHK